MDSTLITVEEQPGMRGKMKGTVLLLLAACAAPLIFYCTRHVMKERRVLRPGKEDLDEIEQGLFKHSRLRIHGYEKEPRLGNVFFGWVRGEITYALGLKEVRGSFPHKSRKIYFRTKQTLAKMLGALNSVQKMRVFLDMVSVGRMLEPVPGDPERSLDAYVYKTLLLLLGINRVKRSTSFKKVYWHIHFVSSEHRKIDVTNNHDPKNPERIDLSTQLMRAINEYVVEMNSLEEDKREGRSNPLDAEECPMQAKIR
jgi:hypothetical protein